MTSKTRKNCFYIVTVVIFSIIVLFPKYKIINPYEKWLNTIALSGLIIFLFFVSKQLIFKTLRDIWNQRKSLSYDDELYKFFTKEKNWVNLVLLSSPFLIPDKVVNNFVEEISFLFKNVNFISVFLLIILVISGYVLTVRDNNKYIPSILMLNILCIISFVCLYYQIISDSVMRNYLPSNSIEINYLYFFDRYIPLIFFPYLLTVLYIHQYLNYLEYNKKTTEKENAFFLLDKEFDNDELDKLDREPYAKELAKKLLIGNFINSFAVGITGKWGSGKTSFIFMIKKVLKNDSTEKIIIEFSPWNSQSSNQIIEDFFKSFQKTLSPYSSTISHEIINYAKQLANTQKGVWSSIPMYILGSFDNSNPINKSFININDSLKVINKKIFIVIDDLDRLDKKEIIEVIRLIRNSANFYNTCFIVGYDKGYVIKAIEDINSYRANYFLEKIFQLEIVLPPLEENTSIDNLKKLIEIHISKDKEAFGSEKKKKLLMIIEDNDFKEIISKYNIRDYKRLLNSFKLNYPLMKDNVVIEEFFIIELLRSKYPNLVWEIYDNFGKLFKTKNSLVSFSEDFDSVLSEILSTIFPNENKNFIISIKNILLLLFTYNENDEIFVDSIKYNHNLHKYFGLNIGSKIVQNFKETMNKDYNTLCADFDYCISHGKLGDLVEKLDRYKTSDSKEYIKYIKALIYLYDNISENKLVDKVHRITVQRLLKNNYYLINLSQPIDEKYFMDEIFMNNEYILTKAKLLKDVISSLSTDYLKHSIMEENISEILNYYLDYISKEYKTKFSLFISSISPNYNEFVEFSNQVYDNKNEKWINEGNSITLEGNIKNQFVEQILKESKNNMISNGILKDVIYKYVENNPLNIFNILTTDINSVLGPHIGLVFLHLFGDRNKFNNLLPQNITKQNPEFLKFEKEYEKWKDKDNFGFDKIRKNRLEKTNKPFLKPTFPENFFKKH